MSVNRNFVVRNGIEVATDLIIADSDNKKVGIGSTRPRVHFDVRGSIASTDSYVGGISTVFAQFDVGIAGTTITALSATGKVGIGTNVPEYRLDVRVPGGVGSGVTGLYVRGDQRVTGNVTIENDLFVDDITADQIDHTRLVTTQWADILTVNVPTTGSIRSGIITFLSTPYPGGIATITTIEMRSNSFATGIITSSTGSDVVYYGDGQFLKNVTRGVGLSTVGSVGVIGIGATVLDFRGSGIGTVSIGSGIGTIFVESSGSRCSIGTVPPSAPAFPPPKVGDLWYSSILGRTFIYYDEVAVGTGYSAFWVDSAPFNVSVLNSIDQIIIDPRFAQSPSLGFKTDTTTGFFSPRPGHFTIVSVASSILNVNPMGIAVTGGIRCTGLSTFSGARFVDINIGVTNNQRIETITGELILDSDAGTVSVADNLKISGITTVASNLGVAGVTTSQHLNVVGVSTFAQNVKIGSGNTSLIVEGDVRVTGILTVGSSSVVIEGPTDTLKVGAGVTIRSGSLDITGVSTFSQLRVTGVTTVGVVTATNIYSDIVTAGVVTAVTAIQATNFYGGGTIPVGGIIMWAGLISAIPTGWALCNGANGTPDLRDRFIIGASVDANISGITTSATTVTGSNAKSGGTKDAIVVSHTHTINDPQHSHSYSDLTNNGTGGGQGGGGADTGSTTVSKTTGSSSTSISINSSGSSGTDQNLPPYLALAFIMRTA